MYISLFAGKNTPRKLALWEAGAHKSLRNVPRLRAMADFKPVVDNAGLERIAATMPKEPYDAVMGRIARGLYFHHTGKVLGAGVPIAVTPHFARPGMEYLPETEIYRIGDDSVVYTFLEAPDNAGATVWLFCWYGEHWTAVITGDAVW